MNNLSKVIVSCLFCFLLFGCTKQTQVTVRTTVMSDFNISVKKFGDPDFELTPPKTNSPAEIKYKSSNLRVATVTGATVKIVGQGSTTITAYQEATGEFTASSIEAQLTATFNVPTLTEFNIPDKKVGDESFVPTAPKSNSAGEFTYTSLNPAVATTDGKKITIVGPGRAEITAAQAASGIYVMGYITTAFTVTAPPPPEPTYGEVVDADGEKYRTITIGKQTWMVDNLRVTHYRNGDKIDNVTTESQWKDSKTGAYCAYKNDNVLIKPYGLLYNWYAVSDARGIAPAGWHVPTDAEWLTLYNYIGGTREDGRKIQERGTEHWDVAIGSNETWFSGRAGGGAVFSLRGTFDDLGTYAYWWSSTEKSATLAPYVLLYVKGYMELQDGDKHYGLSIRCIKD